MARRKIPRLRTVDKTLPLYPLNRFPKNFAFNLGREIVYVLATKGSNVLEGSEWEKIFADCIGANLRPSNVGLDDVIFQSCAWGAKTVKSSNPFSQKKVRLISGRNSPIYSFGESKLVDVEPNHLGSLILEIWNERVSAVRRTFKNLRTIVLIKSSDLTKLNVFEFDTVRYEPDLFEWKWNRNENLEGYSKSQMEHIFTWQPHGSQF